jgi:diaminohydroxyphosphoribosylaminopyrimidine deaminase/5-amino-6-(5-phosphoribosylamino)uracil reductase
VVFTRKPESLPAQAPLFTDEFKDRTLLRQGDHLADVLRGLVAEQGVLSVMTEAGGVFSAALFQAGLVDEVVVYYAPLMCGGPNAALGGAGLSTPVQCEAAEFTQLGDDVRLRALVKHKGV